MNLHQKASLTWNILVSVAARESGFITYKELGDQIGIHHRTVRLVLSIIQDYCLKNQLPPITILVGNKKGLPGKGFIACDIENAEEGKNKVYNENWYNQENPFNYALDGTTENEIVNSLLNHPEEASDIYGKIKARGTAQIIFRKALLKAYNSKCAFCELSFEFALQAAHIIPWSKANNDQRLDVRNGILLCATHHSLFDKGYITVNENYSITISNKQRRLSKYDNLLTQAFHEQKMKLPKIQSLWPKKEYLKNHRSN